MYDPHAIALKMTIRASVLMSGTTTPAARIPRVYRCNVGRESAAPLGTVLDVAPAWLLRGNESISALIERHHACGFTRSVGSVCSPSFDRVNSLISQLSTLQRFLTGLRETDRVERAQAHLTLDIMYLSI